MRDDPAADRRRGHHQPPIVADRAGRRAASPARLGIADADRRRRLRRRSRRPPGCPRKQPQRFGHEDSGGLADRTIRGGRRRSDWRRTGSGRAERRSPRRCADRDRRTGSSRPARAVRLAGIWAISPATQSRWRCAQSSAARRLVRGGQVSDQPAAARVEAELQPPCPAVDVDDRAATAIRHRLGQGQSARSTTCHSSSPASTSLTVQPRVDWPASWTVSRLPETR